VGADAPSGPVAQYRTVLSPASPQKGETYLALKGRAHLPLRECALFPSFVVPLVVL
jgi:hypothetical protein